MIGITSYGAYIPRHRLPLGAIGGRPAREGGPEKAVAWNDEDSITMAVAAAVNCLRDVDRQRVDALYFASTSYAFREKQGAALDRPRARSAAGSPQRMDFASSLRAGTTALRAAIGRGRRRARPAAALVLASDCRTRRAPGSGPRAKRAVTARWRSW